MASLGEVFLRVRPDTAGFAKETTAQVKKGFGGIAGAATKAFAAVGIASFLKASITAASDLNESIAATGEVFGKSAEQVGAAAKQMAEDFGIPQKAFLDGAQAIGSIGKASGLTQKAAAALGEDFTKLAADVSSFKNIPLEEALGAIQSGLVGEAEPLRRFGVLLSDAAVKAEASRLGLTKLGDELTEQQKVQARSSLITKGLADANGDLARTQDSTANQARKAKGAFQEFQITLGKALLPVINLLLPALSSMFKTLKPFVPILIAIAAVLVTVVAVTKAYTAVQTALNVVLSANPIGLIIIAIAALVVGIVIAYKKSQTFRNIVQALFEALKTVGNFIKNVLVFAFKLSPLGLLIANFDKLKRGLQLLFDLLKKVLAPFQALGKVLGTIGRGIAKGLDFLLPGSPPPLAVGIKASADALKAFQALAKRTTLPGFTTGVPALGFAGAAGTRGFSGSITVNQVANDPEATARAVAARLGQRSTR